MFVSIVSILSITMEIERAESSIDSESTVIGEWTLEPYGFCIGVWVESSNHSNCELLFCIELSFAFAFAISAFVDAVDPADPAPDDDDKERREEDKDVDVDNILLMSFDGPTSSIDFILSIKMLLS